MNEGPQVKAISFAWGFFIWIAKFVTMRVWSVRTMKIKPGNREMVVVGQLECLVFAILDIKITGRNRKKLGLNIVMKLILE